MSELSLAYEQIKRDLLTRLGTQFPAGSRLPPGVELAKLLGAGQRNTQRAMAELAREGYLLSRRRRGTFVIEHLERVLRHECEAPLSGFRVGIVCLHPRVDFIRRIVRSVARALRTQGARTTVHSVATVRGVQLDLLGDRPDDGYVLVNPDTSMLMQVPDPTRVVVVSSTSSLADLIGTQVHAVTVDDERGAAMAGQALRRRGCESVCFLGVSDQGASTSYEDVSRVRLRGFEAGFGAPVPDGHRLTGTAFSDVSGVRAAQAYLRLRPRPRGIFAASDELAYGLAVALLSHGLEPQRDYFLVGFDGQFLAGSGDIGGSFATLALPRREMGRAAAHILVKKLTDARTPPQRVRLDCRFIAERTVWLGTREATATPKRGERASRTRQG
jgi:DNA-binding LacI/PurR family transcriptional regulator